MKKESYISRIGALVVNCLSAILIIFLVYSVILLTQQGVSISFEGYFNFVINNPTRPLLATGLGDYLATLFIFVILLIVIIKKKVIKLFLYELISYLITGIVTANVIRYSDYINTSFDKVTKLDQVLFAFAIAVYVISFALILFNVYRLYLLVKQNPKKIVVKKSGVQLNEKESLRIAQEQARLKEIEIKKLKEKEENERRIAELNKKHLEKQKKREEEQRLKREALEAKRELYKKEKEKKRNEINKARELLIKKRAVELANKKKEKEKVIAQKETAKLQKERIHNDIKAHEYEDKFEKQQYELAKKARAKAKALKLKEKEVARKKAIAVKKAKEKKRLNSERVKSMMSKKEQENKEKEKLAKRKKAFMKHYMRTHRY